MFYIAMSYAMWASRSRDNPVNIHTSSIVNWYQNRSLKTISSYVLLFEHSRRLNSIVSNHANNRKFGRMLRWFWNHVSYMQYEHEGVKRAISILELQTSPIDSGIYQRNPHHRISCCLDMADDWILAYQSKQTIGNSDE